MKKCREMTDKAFSPTVTEDETVAIHAVLEDLDTHLGDDLDNNLDDDLEGEDQMMMVENGDLTVEDVDQPRSVRPCAFVAPPPPDEPPPEDVEIVRYSDIMGVKVDTVDIGTETSDDSASFDQGSPKSSPSMYMTVYKANTFHEIISCFFPHNSWSCNFLRMKNTAINIPWRKLTGDPFAQF